MWLDGDQVAGPHEPEKERRHDRNHRGTRGLMSAHFDVVIFGAQVVGEMNLLGGKP